MHKLSLDELREKWTKEWAMKPHSRIGRVMLEKSLAFKQQVNLNVEEQDHLNRLIRDYKRNPNTLGQNNLKASIIAASLKLRMILPDHVGMAGCFLA